MARWLQRLGIEPRSVSTRAIAPGSAGILAGEFPQADKSFGLGLPNNASVPPRPISKHAGKMPTHPLPPCSRRLIAPHLR